MVVPLSLFQGALNRDISHAVGLSAWASPGIVFNTNAFQTQTVLDPLRILAGDETNGDHVRPVVVPSAYYYLNVGLGFSGWTNVQLNVDPVIRVFGLLPREQKPARAYPQDVSSAQFPDLSGTSSGGQWWVPLTTEGATSPNITLTGDLACTLTVSGKRLHTCITTPLYLAGVRRIMVCVTTAAGVHEGAGSSSSGTSGEEEASLESLIYGWFSG
jgi:hypothetical protein